MAQVGERCLNARKLLIFLQENEFFRSMLNRSFSTAYSAIVAEKDQCYFVASVNLSNETLAELVLILRDRLRNLRTSVRTDDLGCL